MSSEDIAEDMQWGEVERHVMDMASLSGLVIQPDWLRDVCFSFGQFKAAADLVLGFPLADSVAPAPRFEP